MVLLFLTDMLYFCQKIVQYFGRSDIDFVAQLSRNKNKANLRDLIATTGLIILLKLDSNFNFGLYDLEIIWVN